MALKFKILVVHVTFSLVLDHSEQLVEDGLTDDDADKFISDEFNKKRMRRLAYKTAPPDHKFGLDWRYASTQSTTCHLIPFSDCL